MASLDERFEGINTKLDEGRNEILAELEKLRAGGSLTEAQEASLQAIEAKANAMADVSPPIEG